VQSTMPESSPGQLSNPAERRGSVTIKEIAQVAQVHRSTVDKVIHERPGVSDKVRARVKKLLAENAYEPNLLGKALKRQTQKLLVGVVLQRVNSLEMLKAGVARAAQSYQGFNVSLRIVSAAYPDAGAQARLIDQLLEDGADGLIVQPISSPEVREAVDRAAAAGVPVLTCNEDLPESRRLCYVGQDGFRAGRVAARLMGEFLGGAGKVVIVAARTNEGSGSTANRTLGFLSLIREEFPGLEVVSHLAGMEDQSVTYHETLQLLKSRPDLDGLYVTTGQVGAVGQAVRELGRAGDLRVIGFERYPEILGLLNEKVITCTIDSDLEEQGYRPCRLLIDHLLYDRRIEQREHFTAISILFKENL